MAAGTSFKSIKWNPALIRRWHEAGKTISWIARGCSYPIGHGNNRVGTRLTLAISTICSRAVVLIFPAGISRGREVVGHGERNASS